VLRIPDGSVSRFPAVRRRTALLYCLALAALLLLAGCAGPGQRSAITDAAGSPGFAAEPGALEAMLAAEFSRLGIDPDKVPGAAPVGDGNAVFDLAAQVVPDVQPQIVFTWTERMLGDFSQDGLVTVSDLTPIGQRYNQAVAYDDAADHDGLAHWPTGDPDGAGAANWRLARVDGNDDGLIYLTDITTIAQHWNERLDGYRLYFKEPGAPEFMLYPNPEDAESPVTVPRSAAAPPDSNSPYRYSVAYEALVFEGEFQFYVAPYDSVDDQIGTPSPVLTLTLPQGQPPTAALTADVTAGNPPLEVNFDASASSDPENALISFDWDFDGDGTYDELTTVPAATHVYDTGAVYTAVVRVEDEEHQLDTASLQITVNQAPAAAIAMTPPEPTVVPFTATFNALGSSDPDGTIVQYDWDWDGDGTYDSIDVGPEPDITRFVTLPGEETVNVRVFDDQGLSDSASQAVVGLYGEWQVQVLATGGVGQDCSLALVDGLPAISYYDSDKWDLGYIRATDEFGADPWGAPVAVTDDFGEEGRYGSLAVINGRPAIAFDNYHDDNTCFIRADDPQGASWPLNPTVILGERTFGVSLVDAGGRPAVAYAVSSNVYYQRADDENGTTWVTVAIHVEDTADACREPSMAVVAGNPAIAFKRLMTDGYWYLAYVAASDPTGTGPWFPDVLADGGMSLDAGINPYLAQIGTTPAITYGVGEESPPDLEPFYVRSTHNQGIMGSWLDPGPQNLTGTMSFHGSHTSTVGIGFHPHAVFMDSDSGTLWHVWSRDFMGGDWMNPVLVDDGGGNFVGSYCHLKNINGRPAVAYYDATAGALKYAVLR